MKKKPYTYHLSYKYTIRSVMRMFVVAAVFLSLLLLLCSVLVKAKKVINKFLITKYECYLLIQKQCVFQFTDKKNERLINGAAA